MLLLYFIKDHAIENEINPKKINKFSFVVKLRALLKNIKYAIRKVIINEGINFDVIKINIDLYLFELNKYLIPIYEFKDKIEDICSG